MAIGCVKRKFKPMRGKGSRVVDQRKIFHSPSKCGLGRGEELMVMFAFLCFVVIYLSSRRREARE